MRRPHDGEKVAQPGKLCEVVFLGVDREPAAPQTLGKGSRRPRENGGLGRGCEPARQAPRCPGTGSGRKNGGGEARRRGGPAPRPDPTPRSGPSRPADPASVPRALTPPRQSRRFTPGNLRNPATLRRERFPPCNTPRKRKMSGDDGGGRVTYPCSSRG